MQEQIEWKRAREPATLEIREYMLDRIEQLMKESGIFEIADEAKMSETASVTDEANMPENTSMVDKAKELLSEQKIQIITERVVEEMGNPIEIGKSLNELHHPRFDAKLFMSMLGMMILGLIFNICCGTSRSVANTVFINLMGIGVVVVSYFLRPFQVLCKR